MLFHFARDEFPKTEYVEAIARTLSASVLHISSQIADSHDGLCALLLMRSNSVSYCSETTIRR